jgi:hypothetical protein
MVVEVLALPKHAVFWPLRFFLKNLIRPGIRSVLIDIDDTPLYGVINL